VVVAVGVSTHSASWIRLGGQLEEQVDCRGVHEPGLFPRTHAFDHKTCYPTAIGKLRLTNRRLRSVLPTLWTQLRSPFVLNFSGYNYFLRLYVCVDIRAFLTQFLKGYDTLNTGKRETSTTAMLSSHVHECQLPIWRHICPGRILYPLVKLLVPEFFFNFSKRCI